MSTPQGNVWNPDAETASSDRLAEIQDERLKEQFALVYASAPLFRSRYQAAGITPSSFRGLEDLRLIPIVGKDDLRRWREQTGDIFGGTLAVDRSRLVVINHSSGTSGAPTVFGLTENDLEAAGEMFARVLFSIGLRAGDRTPVAGTTFWHGYVIGLEVGVRLIGAQSYRIACGAGNCVQEAFEHWKEADFTALRTYIPDLEIPYLQGQGINPSSVFPNARFVYAGFDASPAKRRLIEEAWGMPFRNTMGSGDQYLVGGECEVSAPYFHVPEDGFVFEVLDPDTGTSVPPGGIGELVITNLWAEGCPYLRYRMEDIVTYEVGQCPCGRTTMRIKMLGRLAWSVLVGSTRILSTEVEEVLWSQPDLRGIPYQLVRRRRQPQERLEVRLDTSNRSSQVDFAAVGTALAQHFGLLTRVTLAPDGIGIKGPNKMERIVVLD